MASELLDADRGTDPLQLYAAAPAHLRRSAVSACIGLLEFFNRGVRICYFIVLFSVLFINLLLGRIPVSPAFHHRQYINANQRQYQWPKCHADTIHQTNRRKQQIQSHSPMTPVSLRTGHRIAPAPQVYFVTALKAPRLADGDRADQSPASSPLQSQIGSRIECKKVNGHPVIENKLQQSVGDHMKHNRQLCRQGRHSAAK